MNLSLPNFKRTFFASLVLCFSIQSFAATQAVTAKISRTLAGSGWGGCMIALDVAFVAPCPATGWVSLDCDGLYVDAVAGNNQFSSALTAFSMDKTVVVYASDTNFSGGYCSVFRIDVIK